MSPRTLFEKMWDAHVVAPESTDTPAILYIDLHLVHEVTSPQAFSELRERGLKLRRADRMLATLDHSTPTLPAGADGERPYANAEAKAAGSAAGNELPRVRCRTARLGQQRSRHRARDRSRAGRDPAGHDHRLRRQPHLDAWCIRRAGLRHRHHRGRSRDGHAVPAATQAEDLRDPGGWSAAGRRGREGSDPAHHRRDRRGRRHRLRPRIPRRCHRSDVDGRAHDGVQHVDRSRCTRGPDRAGRHHVRLAQGPSARTAGRCMGCRRGALARTAQR